MPISGTAHKTLETTLTITAIKENCATIVKWRVIPSAEHPAAGTDSLTNIVTKANNYMDSMYLMSTFI